jgi:hypothetical protein
LSITVSEQTKTQETLKTRPLHCFEVFCSHVSSWCQIVSKAL